MSLDQEQPVTPLALPAARQVVYYAQDQQDGLIKVGCSKNVDSRLTVAASSYRRAFVLLATEPGGLALEAQRHQEFDALRVRDPHLHPGESGELFKPEAPILRHINGLAKPEQERVYGKVDWEHRQVRLSPHAVKQLELHLAANSTLSLHKLVEEAILNEIEPLRRWGTQAAGWSLNFPT